MRVVPAAGLERALKKLRRAVARLEASAGRIARRNARAALGAAMRAVRRAADEDFPPIRELQPAGGRKWDSAVWRAMSPEQRATARSKRQKARDRRLSEAGFVPVPFGRQGQVMQDCAAAGVRVRLGANNYPWVKSWVLYAAPGDVTKLKKAKRSANFRKALMAEHLLREQVRREDGSLPGAIP